MFHVSLKIGKNDVELKARGIPLSRVSLLVLVRPSTGWVRPTHMGRATCFTQSTNSNVRLIQNTLPDTFRIKSDQIYGYLMARQVAA